jgi:hypothetical protein
LLKPKNEEEIKTHFAERKAKKTWRNYNEKQFGRREKMKNGRLF